MKKQLIIMVLALSASSTSFISCKSRESNTSAKACDNHAQVVKTATNESGTLMRDEVSGRYAIQIATPQTIDEQKIYLICNPPATLPQENTKVNFSGTVRVSSQVSKLGGLTYYDIEVSSLK